MSVTILALRPEPGLAATLEKARMAGLVITGVALSEIRSVAWDCPDPAAFDGLLIGSANVFLHGGANLAALTRTPVFAVGEATGDAARAAGFAVAAIGTGGLQGVLDAIPAPCRLLRIAGEEHVPLDIPPGVTVTTVIAYRSVTLPLDPAAPLLAEGTALVLLHSAATARYFADECDRIGIARNSITLATLGPRIAGAAGSGWRAIHTAPHPDEAALLEMVFDLCKKRATIPVPTAGKP